MATLALPDIAKLNGSPRAHGLFEFCDYAASTLTMNFCSGYESEIEDDRRSRYYNSLKSSMTPEQQAAFEKLLAAQNAYIEAHASEVDQGGTIRAIRTGFVRGLPSAQAAPAMHMHGLRSNLPGARCRDKSGKKHKPGVYWGRKLSLLLRAAEWMHMRSSPRHVRGMWSGRQRRSQAHSSQQEWLS
jgi:hypothetical protein